MSISTERLKRALILAEAVNEFPDFLDDLVSDEPSEGYVRRVVRMGVWDETEDLGGTGGEVEIVIDLQTMRLLCPMIRSRIVAELRELCDGELLDLSEHVA